MDSLTQAVLGGAVGEAVAGRKVGRRALVVGALAGTLPDLDVLAAPFLSEPAMLHFHRGPTHSLLFAFVAAPLLGWLTAWFYRKRAGAYVRWQMWAAVWFWGLWTHPLLDLFTNWGTQLLWPITDHPFALSSVFIIDPAYTLPLLAAVGYAAFSRSPRRRLRAVVGAFAVSTVYLAWGLVAQRHAANVFRSELGRQGIAYHRLLVQPSPLNTVLWTGLAEGRDGFYQGYYGFLDDDRRVRFRAVPRTTAPLDGLAETEPVRTLRWFSKGWLTAERRADRAPLAHDLRFGRSDLWLNPGPAPYVFTFRLVQDDRRWTFRQEATRFDRSADVVRRFGRRVLGDETVEPPAAPRVPASTQPPPP